MQYLDDVTGCFIAKIFVINQPVLSTVYRFPSNFRGRTKKNKRRRRHQIERRAITFEKKKGKCPVIEEMSDFSTEEGWRAAGWHEVRVYLGMSEEKVNELVVAGWQPVDLLWASTEGLAELHLAILTKSRIAAAIAKVRAPSVGGVPSDYDVYKQGVSAVRVFVGEQKDLLRFIYDVEMNVKVGSCVGGIRVRVAMNRMDGDAKKWLLMKEKRNERFQTDAGWVQMKEEMNSLWMYVDEEQDALDAIAEMEWDPKTMDGSSFVVRF